MKEILKGKFKEALISIGPILIVVFLLNFILNFETIDLVKFTISTVLLIIGMTLYTFGASISMLTLGEQIGKYLMKNRKVFLILFVSLVIGIATTVAEPDLKVLASQMTAIPQWLLILGISVGVGIFLLISSLRTLFRINISLILIIGYAIAFILIFFINPSFIPLAFDSSGVTTGSITVPFVMSLGLGLASMRTDKNAKDDSFGLIALCSIGPIITVMIISMFFDASTTYQLADNTTNLVTLFSTKFMMCIKQVSISMLPIIIIFLVFQLTTKTNSKEKIKSIVFGMVVTLLGLTIFLTGVNSGFMNIGYQIGIKSIEISKILLVIFGVLIGYFIVSAEPAVRILTVQVEELTSGSISKKIMQLSLSVSVALSVGLALLRSVTGISILYFLIPGYLFSLIMTFFVPKIFTAVAFDSGGACSGPLTATFLFPIALGACLTINGNPLTDAFGLIAFVSMTPLITIQALGLVYKIKLLKEISKYDLDETIIDYDWEEA